MKHECTKAGRLPRTPTGFRHSAQGCRVGIRSTATLGARPTNISPLLAKIFYQGERYQYEERGQGRGARAIRLPFCPNQLPQPGLGTPK